MQRFSTIVRKWLSWVRQRVPRRGARRPRGWTASMGACARCSARPARLGQGRPRDVEGSVAGGGRRTALLELQPQIEQIDASHIANAGEERLKYYNKVLGVAQGGTAARRDGLLHGVRLRARRQAEPRQAGGAGPSKTSRRPSRTAIFALLVVAPEQIGDRPDERRQGLVIHRVRAASGWLASISSET